MAGFQMSTEGSTLVDLLITDYLMPDGTGEELITRLRETHPALKVLILTGHGARLMRDSAGGRMSGT
jgi:DNA-binding NarL/FixJ family response regulator